MLYSTCALSTLVLAKSSSTKKRRTLRPARKDRREHGDTCLDGIQLRFDILKARLDSSWNWARQADLTMFYGIIIGHMHMTTAGREITARCITLLDCADPDVLRYVQYNIDHYGAWKDETCVLGKEFA